MLITFGIDLGNGTVGLSFDINEEEFDDVGELLKKVKEASAILVKSVIDKLEEVKKDD